MSPHRPRAPWGPLFTLTRAQGGATTMAVVKGLALVALAVSLVNACGGNAVEESPAGLPGVWLEMVEPSLLSSWEMTFEATGRYGRRYLPATQDNPERGAWATAGDHLMLTPDGAVAWPDLRWQLKGDRLDITWPPHLLIPFTRAGK
jgi:hypothetical protein